MITFCFFLIVLNAATEGRLLMGCGGSYVQRQPDVVVQGTGVEPIHCYIENINGVVSLYPLGEMTSVDGLPVATPTRLTQGILLKKFINSFFFVCVSLNPTCSFHGWGRTKPIGHVGRVVLTPRCVSRRIMISFVLLVSMLAELAGLVPSFNE